MLFVSGLQANSKPSRLLSLLMHGIMSSRSFAPNDAVCLNILLF